MKHLFSMLIVTLVVSFGLAPQAQAESAAVLKSRMAKRLGDVVALKKSGAVGENNKGYLTVRGSVNAKQAAIIKAENADRKAVYSIIAKKAKSSAASVGKTRAASIRKSAPKGTWVQLPDGTWKKS